jgi:IS5 family transposase
MTANGRWIRPEAGRARQASTATSEEAHLVVLWRAGKHTSAELAEPQGKPSAARRDVEDRPAFRQTIEWRTGREGRISILKRQYGWDRTKSDGTEGVRIWAGRGVLTHNLVHISALAA